MTLLLDCFLLAAVCLVTYIFVANRKRFKNLPPGPTGLPFIGSALTLTSKPFLRFGEWVKDYGKIYIVNVVNYRVAVISDAQIAREAFNNSHLIGNPDFPLLTAFFDNGYGILGSDGHTWVDQRRFTMRHLREFGFGKSTIQDLYMAEVNEFVDWLKTMEGQSVSLNRKFSLAAINALWMIMTGKRFEQDDETLGQMLTNQNRVFLDMSRSPFVLLFPALARKLPKLSGWASMEACINRFKALMAQPVDERLKEFSPDDAPRDFLDSYLKEMHGTKDPKSTFFKSTGEKNLKAILKDLFGAGTETTAQTLSFAILYLTKFPDIQLKLQQEIDTVVGDARQVTLEDRKSMPFMEAVIMETLRMSSIAPYGIVHSATETTTVAGYTIPKGTWMVVNLHFIHHDPEVWGDPENFRPERFLSPDGTTILKNDSLIPFLVGKRVCIGEQLGKDGVFLFLSNIYQKFSTAFDPSFREPGLDGDSGFFTQCEIFNLLLTQRSK